MDIHPECRDLHQEVNQLIEMTDSWPIEDSGLPKSGLAGQLQKLAEKRAALDSCVAQHPRGYQTQVVVRDFSPGGASLFLPVRAVLWELAPSTGMQRVLEIEAVQDQTISFWGTGAAASDRSIGLSVHEAPNLRFPGPLFRSGALPALPPGAPDPAGLIEIGIPKPPPPIQVATINSMLPPVGTVLSTAPIVTVAPPAPTVRLTADADDSPGSATLRLDGTLEMSAGPVGSATIPFQLTVTVRITPSADMNAATSVCRLAATAPASLTTTAPAPWGSLFAGLAQTLAPLLTDSVIGYLSKILNPAILTAVAGAFGLPALPAGVVVSMRSVAIDSTQVRFFLALGAFGGLFSRLPPFP